MKRAQFKHICLVRHNSAWFKELRGCRQNRHGEERSDEAIQWSLDLAAMDCFAEPVIGRAFARPVGSQ